MTATATSTSAPRLTSPPAHASGPAHPRAILTIILVAASASVTDLAVRVSTALTWGSGLLAAALVVTIVVIVPAERMHHG